LSDEGICWQGMELKNIHANSELSKYFGAQDKYRLQLPLTEINSIERSPS